MKPNIIIPSCLLLASGALFGDGFSLNFAANEASGSINTAAAANPAGAIPVSGEYWNNLLGPNGGAIDPINNTGAVLSGVTVDWTSANTWRSGSTGATATSENGALTKGYLDDGAGGWTVDINSPFLLNDVYVIHGTDQGNPANMSALSVNGTYYKGDGAGGTIVASGSGDSWNATNWTDADTLVESDNYLSVLAQPGVNLRVDTSSPGRGALAGVQIEDAYTGTLSYWDIDGATPGAGGATPDGLWSGLNWSTSAAGDAAGGLWTAGHAAVFSAGTDATGFYTVTLAAPESADAVWVQDGFVTLTGGSLNLGATGILRGDDPNFFGDGLQVDSTVSATDLTTVGNVTLNGIGNTVTGTASINGLTILGADHTFPKIAGGGVLDIGATALTLGDASNSIFGGSFEGGGTIDKVGAGDLTLGSVSDNFNGSATVSAGTLSFDAAGSLFWPVSGAGNFTKKGGGQLTVESDVSTTGALNVDGGTLQVGNVGLDGSIGTPSSITLTTGGLALRYRLSGADATIDTTPVSFVNAGSTLRQHGGTAADKLTFTNTTLGTDPTLGTIDSLGGELVFGAGTTAQFNMLALSNGTATIEAGADLTFRYANIGNAGGAGGIVNQTGGDVTMLAGNAGIRIGHWSGAGREYNLTGGTLDATALAANGGEGAWVNMGWDGEGDMTVGGGAGTATLNASGLRFDRNRGGAGSSASTITILPNGVVETTLGTQGNGDNDGVVMSGGLLRGMATATWAAPMEAVTATTSVLDVVGGATATQSGLLFGDGALTKTGAGTLVLNNALNSHNGTVTVSGGDLKVNGITTSDVTVQSGAAIGTGLAGAAGSGEVDILTLEAGSTSNFRVGGTTDDQLSVFITDSLTVNTAHTISVSPVGVVAVNDQFPVINYDGTIQGDGFGGLSLAAFPNPHYTLSLVDNALDTTVDVKVDAVTPVTWAGPGAWNLVNSNWDDGGGASAFYDADIAIFNDLGAAESVVVDDNGGADPIAPASMTFNNTTATTYTISGDPIGGSGGLTKTGDGTVILANDSTFGGVIDIQAGILQVGDGATSGTLGAGGAITVATGAQFIADRSDASTLGRAVIGDGTFIKNGAGALTATAGGGAADIVINNGTLLARGGGWTVGFNAGQPITVNAGGTLDTVVHSLGGLGAGGILPSSITLNGGNWLLNNEQYINILNMTAGTTSGAGEVRTTGGGIYTVNADSNPSVLGARLSMVGAKVIQVADGAADPDLLISGPIVGGGNLTKSGPGRMVSSGANTGGGAITIPEGRVAMTGDNSARTGNYEVTGGILEATSMLDAAIGTGSLALKGGTLEYLGTGIESTTRNLWIDAGGQSGTFDIVDAGAVLTMNPAAGTVNQAVIKNGAGRLVLNGAISGGASVTVNAGRLDLGGANTYTGETTVETGATLVMSIPTLDDGSTLNINGTGKIDLGHGLADVVDALLIDGVPQPTGTYGATGSGADNIDDVHFVGSGVIEVGTDYGTWAQSFGLDPDTDGAPGADADGDGLTNVEEYSWALDPTDPASSHPISVMLDKGLGTFSYTRRDPALTGYTYSYEASTTTSTITWVAFTPDAEVPAGTPDQSVEVTVPGALLANPTLLVRVVATPDAPAQ